MLLCNYVAKYNICFAVKLKLRILIFTFFLISGEYPSQVEFEKSTLKRELSSGEFYNITKLCEVWSSYGSENKHFNFLGYDTVQIGRIYKHILKMEAVLSN